MRMPILRSKASMKSFVKTTRGKVLLALDITCWVVLIAVLIFIFN